MLSRITYFDFFQPMPLILQNMQNILVKFFAKKMVTSEFLLFSFFIVIQIYVSY